MNPRKSSRACSASFVSPALAVEKDWDAMVESAKSLVSRRMEGVSEASFKVIARRADKRFAMRSQDICRVMGALWMRFLRFA
jgi:thiamine biosynthesis protein ThiI